MARNKMSDEQRKAFFASMAQGKGGVAQKQKQKKKKRGFSIGPAVAGVLGSGFVGAAPLAAVALLTKGKGLGRLMKSQSRSHAGPLFRNLRGATNTINKGASNIPMEIGSLTSKATGAAFLNPLAAKAARALSLRKSPGTLPTKPRIFLPARNPTLAAHELGHATFHLDKTGAPRKVLSNVLGASRAGVAQGTIGLGSIGAHVGIANSNMTDSQKRRAHRTTLAVTAAAIAPTLFDEAVASKRALTILKRAGASKRRRKFARRDLGVAYSTYLSQAGNSIGGSAIASALYQRRNKRR